MVRSSLTTSLNLSGTEGWTNDAAAGGRSVASRNGLTAATVAVLHGAREARF